MKVRVLQPFRDKHTKEIHKANKEMEISKKRFDEILTVGELVEEIKEEVQEEVQEEPKEPSRKKTTKRTTKKVAE